MPQLPFPSHAVVTRTLRLEPRIRTRTEKGRRRRLVTTLKLWPPSREASNP